jgi:hypothetical protein
MTLALKTSYNGRCPHECPDICSIIIEVQDDKLIGVKGNPDHPMGDINPDRLLFPILNIRCAIPQSTNFLFHFQPRIQKLAKIKLSNI